MVCLILRFSNQEVERYFKEYKNAIDYVINTDIHKDKNFKECLIANVTLNKYGMYQVNSNEYIYHASREELEKY